MNERERKKEKRGEKKIIGRGILPRFLLPWLIIKRRSTSTNIEEVIRANRLKGERESKKEKERAEGEATLKRARRKKGKYRFSSKHFYFVLLLISNGSIKTLISSPHHMRIKKDYQVNASSPRPPHVPVNPTDPLSHLDGLVSRPIAVRPEKPIGSGWTIWPSSSSSPFSFHHFSFFSLATSTIPQS